jgi:hypothetical protein
MLTYSPHLLLFEGTGVLTHGLTIAREVLYHTFISFFFSLSDRVLIFACGHSQTLICLYVRATFLG